MAIFILRTLNPSVRSIGAGGAGKNEIKGGKSVGKRAEEERAKWMGFWEVDRWRKRRQAGLEGLEEGEGERWMCCRSERIDC